MQQYIRYLASFALLFYAITPAPGQIYSIHGQASTWILSDPDEFPISQIGLRYIPEGSLAVQLDSSLVIDADVSLNSDGTASFSRDQPTELQAKVKPYRAWIRLSGSRFEARVGLQKINFGPAILFRPLMWFDRVDPRDPLQMTDGVYALLGRYYFLNNTNIWLWGLYGNDEPKGWEYVPTTTKSPEYGGRIQTPLASGEVGASYHHRQVNFHALTGYPYPEQENHVPEDRFALDGKWDIGVGAWFEAVLMHEQTEYLTKPYQRLWTAGIDYTFDIGNGLTALTEYSRIENAVKAFSSGLRKFEFSGLSLNYPLSLLDRLSCILYRDWTNREWYRIFTWQRLYDNWIIYLLGFWNPEKINLFQNQGTQSSFSGTGIQLMVVFNH